MTLDRSQTFGIIIDEVTPVANELDPTQIDAIEHAGCHSQGLPFKIRTRIEPNSDPDRTQTFIDTHILPLIPLYAEELSTRPIGRNVVLERDRFDPLTHLLTVPFPTANIAIDIDMAYECRGEIHIRTCKIILNNGRICLPESISESSEDVLEEIRAERNNRLENIYDQEEARLDELMQAHSNNAEFMGKVTNLKNTINRLKDASENNLPELIRTLVVLNQAIANPEPKNIDALEKCAKEVKGKPSLLWKTLGMGLMVLGSLLILLGAALTVAAIPGVASPACPVAGLSVGVGIGIAAGGAMCLAAGIGFFKLGKQKNISKKIQEGVEGVRGLRG